MADQAIVPPFDPELAPVLKLAKNGPLPPISAGTLAAYRAAEALDEQADLTAGGTVRVEEVTVPGPQGAQDITVVVLRPAAGAGPWPLLYHTHGGGMIIGSARHDLPDYLDYVAQGLAVIASVEYRLAPEHPDPAPVEDCYAGLAWAARNAAKLSIDPGRIIIIGASAGGGLAAGTALLARDRGFPALSHQVLICPMLDDRCETPSSRMLDRQGFWDRNDNAFGWTSLLGDRRGGPDVSAYAAPARAADLSGLPRTYIDVGGSETFRDEAVGYATRLSQAGVSVDLHVWAGGFHRFDVMAPQAAVSKVARHVRDEFIRRALG